MSCWLGRKRTGRPEPRTNAATRNSWKKARPPVVTERKLPNQIRGSARECPARHGPSRNSMLRIGTRPAHTHPQPHDAWTALTGRKAGKRSLSVPPFQYLVLRSLTRALSGSCGVQRCLTAWSCSPVPPLPINTHPQSSNPVQQQADSTATVRPLRAQLLPLRSR